MKTSKHIKKSSGRKNPQIHNTVEGRSCPATAQLARLDSRLGVGVGAHKERTKLNLIIQGENDGK